MVARELYRANSVQINVDSNHEASRETKEFTALMALSLIPLIVLLLVRWKWLNPSAICKRMFKLRKWADLSGAERKALFFDGYWRNICGTSAIRNVQDIIAESSGIIWSSKSEALAVFKENEFTLLGKMFVVSLIPLWMNQLFVNWNSTYSQVMWLHETKNWMFEHYHPHDEL